MKPNKNSNKQKHHYTKRETKEIAFVFSPNEWLYQCSVETVSGVMKEESSMVY